MRSRRLFAGGFLAACLFFFVLPVIAEAGGPQEVNAAGTPYRWRGPIVLRPAGGGLGPYTHEKVVAMVQEAINTWKNVPHAALPEITIGDPLGEDIGTTTLNKYLNPTDGITPIIFDSDGTIIHSLCSVAGESCETRIPGIAFGISFVDDPNQGPTIKEGAIILNGLRTRGGGGFGFDPLAEKPEPLRSQIVGTAIHELGHLLGLDHSQLNVGASKDADTSTDTGLPSMFPFVHADVETLHRDDQAAIATLYPSSTGDLKAITGQIVVGPDRRGFQGANVVVRRVEGQDPQGRPLGSNIEAVSVVSGVRYRKGNPDMTLQGLYEAKGLPPGDYLVFVEPIDPSLGDRSGIGDTSIGPLDPPAPLPGRSEYYNGANESDQKTDRPDDRVPVKAGATGEKIDILLNLQSPAIPISREIHSQFLSDIAFDGENYLVVWMDVRSCSTLYPPKAPPYFFPECGHDIFGARVTPEGEVLDPKGFPISTVIGAQQFPRVSFANGRYLVVWEDGRLNGRTYENICPGSLEVCSPPVDIDFSLFDIYGTLIDPRYKDPETGKTDLKVLNPEGFLISTGETPEGHWGEFNPNVASDGSSFMVVYVGRGTWATRVKSDGKVLDKYYNKDNDQRIRVVGNSIPPAIAYGAGMYMIGGYEDFVFVSADGSNVSKTWSYAGTTFLHNAPVDITYANRTFFVVSENWNIGSVQKYSAFLDPDRGPRIMGGFVPAEAAFQGGKFELFPISTRRGGVERPRVGWDGTQFVVVWQQFQGTPDDFKFTTNAPSFYDVLGARVSLSGKVLDSSDLEIMTDPESQTRPTLGFGKGKFLVAWRDRQLQPSSRKDEEPFKVLSNVDIYGQLMTFPGLMAIPDRLRFVDKGGGSLSLTKELLLADPLGINTTTWRVVDKPAWLTVLPESGGVPLNLTVTANPAGLSGSVPEGKIVFEINPDLALPPSSDASTLKVPVVLEMEMFLSRVSDEILEGEINSTSPSLIVRVTKGGKPQPDLKIAWKYTRSNLSSNEVFGTTNPNGESDFRFFLGESPGEYTVTATCEKCDPTAKEVTFTVFALDLAITLVPGISANMVSEGNKKVPFAYPRPLRDAIHDNQVKVKVKILPEGLPSERLQDRGVTFSVISASDGGHDVGHTGERPTGGFWKLLPDAKVVKVVKEDGQVIKKDNTCLTSAHQAQEDANGGPVKKGVEKTDLEGKVEGVYTSCEVSGVETIEIRMELKGTTTLLKKTSTIRVEVPGLVALTRQPNDKFELTGGDPRQHKHTQNHFGTRVSVERMRKIANKYSEIMSEIMKGKHLGINDMSLPQGGMFDVEGKWSTSGGHSSHRDGKDADIDRSHAVGGGLVKQAKLEEIVLNQKAHRLLLEKNQGGPDCIPDKANQPVPRTNPVEYKLCRMHIDLE